MKRMVIILVCCLVPLTSLAEENFFVTYQKGIGLDTGVKCQISCPLLNESILAIPALTRIQKITLTAVMAGVDYHQTVEAVVVHPDHFQELNPVLGKHPDRTSLILFGFMGVTTIGVLSKSEHPLMKVLVDSIIATEQRNIWENQYKMSRRTTLPIIIVASFNF